MPDKRQKLIYLVTEDGYFCSHRLALACAAMENNFEVIVATRIGKYRTVIDDRGIRTIPIRLRRSSKNIFKELSAIAELIRIYRNERPDIVHHVALKPVIYGSIAAWIGGVPSVVNAFAGMGYVYISDKLSVRFIRGLLNYVFRILLNRRNSLLILQNPDDFKYLTDAKVVKMDKIALIRGSGVDTNLFHFTDETVGTPLVVLASRMLWDKGIGEFVAAAQILKKRGVNANFMLAGDNDPDNPAAISTEQLKIWNNEGVVQWIGHTEDIPGLFSRAHIVCLPSYREGLPKVLIEAAACGRPIVTTDVPGCREVVRQGVNGFLVPVKDVLSLADSLLKLINNPSLRVQMGKKGREIAEKEFSIERVIEETLVTYRRLTL